MDDLIMLIESTANMLRGMCMDPRIPQEIKEVMRDRIARLEDAADLANHEGEP